MKKLFTEPLLLILCFQIFLIIRFFKTKSEVERKRLLWSWVGSLAVLWILSLPVVANLFQRTLWVSPPPEVQAAQEKNLEVIAVLSGGFRREPEPKMDFLNEETASRVLHAVDWWRRLPHARLVMTGANSPDELRGFDREVTLMADLAVRHGVPADKIALEITATDTSTHSPGLLQLPGITPETKIGIVTSPWHTKRALVEFRRYFRDVAVYPYKAGDLEAEFWQSYLPRRSALAHSTTLFHEWLGILRAASRG